MNEIGNVKGINGTSMALNTQKGVGSDKPMATGNSNPGGTKPERVSEKPVPMPK